MKPPVCARNRSEGAVAGWISQESSRIWVLGFGGLRSRLSFESVLVDSVDRLHVHVRESTGVLPLRRFLSVVSNLLLPVVMLVGFVVMAPLATKIG